MLRLTAQAPIRWRRLSSNVRQQVAALKVLASAVGAAVAAEYRMPCLLGAFTVRVSNGATSFCLRAQGPSGSSSASGRFAGSAVFNSRAAGWSFQRRRFSLGLRLSLWGLAVASSRWVAV